MKLKKFFALAAVTVMATGLVACGSGNANSNTTAATTQYEKQNVTIASLKGPTSIGLVKLMDDSESGSAANNYDFTIAASADEFTSNLIKGDINIAAVPCNLAANLYNKSNGKVKTLAINTLGVLYICDTGSSVNSVSDLKGKTIYSTGKGTTPEYTLRYLLKSAGIDPDNDVTIEFKSEASEVAAVMNSSADEVIAMLPQPYVTTVTMSNANVRVALDVTKEWEKISGADKSVVTGVVVVNSDYYDKNKAAVDKFMEEYKTSVDYVNANVDAAAQLVEKFDIFKAAVAKKAIPDCNITFVDGSKMKTMVSSYLQVLYDENPASIGGSMPGDDFYIN